MATCTICNREEPDETKKALSYYDTICFRTLLKDLLPERESSLCYKLGYERLKRAQELEQERRDRCTGGLVHDEYTLCPVHD